MLGIFYGLASIMVEQCRLSNIVSRFDSRLARLETKVAGVNLPMGDSTLSFPIFRSMESYVDVENHDKNLVGLEIKNVASISTIFCITIFY